VQAAGERDCAKELIVDRISFVSYQSVAHERHGSFLRVLLRTLHLHVTPPSRWMIFRLGGDPEPKPGAGPVVLVSRSSWSARPLGSAAVVVADLAARDEVPLAERAEVETELVDELDQSIIGHQAAGLPHQPVDSQSRSSRA
jgi:hypothetical protein